MPGVALTPATPPINAYHAPPVPHSAQYSAPCCCGAFPDWLASVVRSPGGRVHANVVLDRAQRSAQRGRRADRIHCLGVRRAACGRASWRGRFVGGDGRSFCCGAVRRGRAGFGYVRGQSCCPASGSYGLFHSAFASVLASLFPFILLLVLSFVMISFTVTLDFTSHHVLQLRPID